MKIKIIYSIFYYIWGDGSTNPNNNKITSLDGNPNIQGGGAVGVSLSKIFNKLESTSYTLSKYNNLKSVGNGEKGENTAYNTLYTIVDNLPVIGFANRGANSWNRGDYFDSFGWYGIAALEFFSMSGILTNAISKVGTESVERLTNLFIKSEVKSVLVNESVELNYTRFLNKIPSNSKSSARKILLKNGNYLFEANSPSSHIPGSYANYQKWVDSKGNTIQYLKTTYGPKGEIIHIKRK